MNVTPPAQGMPVIPDVRDFDRNSGNLLELAVRAARAKATVGEISAALESACGKASVRALDHVGQRVPAVPPVLVGQ